NPPGLSVRGRVLYGAALLHGVARKERAEALALERSLRGRRQESLAWLAQRRGGRNQRCALGVAARVSQRRLERLERVVGLTHHALTMCHCWLRQCHLRQARPPHIGHPWTLVMRETSTFNFASFFPHSSGTVWSSKKNNLGSNELEMSGSGSNAVAKRPSGGNRWASRRVRALNSLQSS
ncbi:MAG: hypothetical protein ACPIOQ_48735, partial [Promethearchaeia archaeon]